MPVTVTGKLMRRELKQIAASLGRGSSIVTREAWHRWGDDDERGALNHIGAAQVRDAATLVRSGEVLELAQPLSPRTPVPQHRAGVQHFMGRDGGDYAAGARRPGGFQFAEDTVVLPLHIGTHIDALCHAWYDDALYNGFPGSGTRSTSGATRCGIDKMGPIVGRGVLLDVAGVLAGRCRMAPRSVAPICERAAAQAEVAVGKGDIVLIRTGWAEQPGPRGRLSRSTANPASMSRPRCGLPNARSPCWALTILRSRSIPFPQGTVFPVHQRLIRDFGIPLLEGLVLHELAATGRREFLFAASPLPVVGGTGSPISPIAIL